MRCTECGADAVVFERVTRALSAGLPEVMIEGLEVGTCSDCGESFSAFPRWTALNALVVAALVGKTSRLTAGEIRFLRQGMGLKAQALAEILGVTPSQLSRWENGAVPISALADRLLRMVVAAREGLAPPDLKSIDPRRSAPLAMRIVLGRRGWKVREGLSKAA
jgi:putative zinc finger/helix-turn-helix YgiT family protein